MFRVRTALEHARTGAVNGGRRASYYLAWTFSVLLAIVLSFPFLSVLVLHFADSKIVLQPSVWYRDTEGSHLAAQVRDESHAKVNSAGPPDSITVRLLPSAGEPSYPTTPLT